jgi:hypothetical protein
VGSAGYRFTMAKRASRVRAHGRVLLVQSRQVGPGHRDARIRAKGELSIDGCHGHTLSSCSQICAALHRERTSTRLERGGEDLRVLVLRRRTVSVDEEILAAMVCALQRCAWLDVNQSPDGNVMTLRRFTDVHRQRAREDDERLLLKRVSVAAPRCARRITPDVCARMSKASHVAEFGHVARGLRRLVRARSPREFIWNNYAESHTHTLIAIRLGPRPASTLQPTVEIHNRSRVLGHCRIARKAGGSMVGLDVPASDCDEGGPPRWQAPFVTENEPEEART